MMLGHTVLMVKVLRQIHNCTLPILVAYNGPSEREADLIEQIQVTIVTASASHTTV